MENIKTEKMKRIFGVISEELVHWNLGTDEAGSHHGEKTLWAREAGSHRGEKTPWAVMGEKILDADEGMGQKTPCGEDADSSKAGVLA